MVVPLLTTEDIIPTHHNYYAVMHFSTERDLGVGSDKNVLLNTDNKFFYNGKEALKYFLDSPRQYVRMATGDNIDDLKKDMSRIVKNIKKSKLWDI